MNRDRLLRRLLLGAGLLVLFGGYLFYALVRDPRASFVGLTAPDALVASSPAPFLPESLYHSLPSFLYVAGFALLCLGAAGVRSRRAFRIPLWWLAAAVLFESGQYFGPAFAPFLHVDAADSTLWNMIAGSLVAGTFDVNDIAAAALGAMVIIVLTAFLRGHRPMLSVPALPRTAGIALRGATAVAGFIALVATSVPPYWTDDCRYYQTRPIYLTYEELRQPVSASEPRNLSSIGKIYVYGNLVLVNVRNKGIHIFDNTDPAAPLNIAFLDIPGNLDIAVRSDVLYADSYVDLVVIDIGIPTGAYEIKRLENVFPYNAHQNISNPAWFPYNPDSGVVVGTEEKCVE